MNRSPSRFWGSLPVFPYLIIAVGAAASLLEFRFYLVGAYEDDAAYVLGGLALASGSFSDLSAPIPLVMTNYFPGLSLLLFPFVQVVSPHWNLLRWLPWLVSVGSHVLAWRFVRSWLSPAAGIAFLGLWIFSPLDLQMSVRVMTEPFLLCLTFLSLNLIRWIEGEGGGPAHFLLALSLAVAASMRPEGMVLGAVCAFVLGATGRGSAALAAAAGCGLGSLAALAPSWFIAGQPEVYRSVLLDGLVQAGRDYGVFVKHILNITGLIGREAFAGGIDEVWAKWTALFGVPMAVFGLLKFIRRTDVPAASSFALFLYPLALLLIHWLWFYFDRRYAYPIVPFLLFFAVAGVESMARNRPWAKAAGVMAGVLLLAASLVVSIRRWSHPPSFAVSAVLPKTMSWMRESIEPGAVVLSSVRYVTRLYTGFPGQNFFPSAGFDDFRAGLFSRHVTHVLLNTHIYSAPLGLKLTSSQNAGFHRDAVGYVTGHPESFRMIHGEPSEMAYVYRVESLAPFAKAYGLYEKARDAYAAGNLKEASLLSDRALAADPSLSSALSLRALCLEEKRSSWSESLRLHRRAVALDPRNLVFRANAARLLARMGREAEARAEAAEISRLQGLE